MSAKRPLESVRRAFRIVWLLQGHAYDGVRLKQVAEALGATACTALRDLETLREEGVTERIPGNEDCWRLAPKLIQVARAHEMDVARQRQKIDDYHNRCTRLPG